MRATRFARHEKVFVKMKAIDPGAFLATITDVTVDKKHRRGYSIRFEDKKRTTLTVQHFDVPYTLFKEADVKAGRFEPCFDEECIGYVVGEEYLGRRSREEVIAGIELSEFTYMKGEKLLCRPTKETLGWWNAEVTEVEEQDGGLLRYQIKYTSDKGDKTYWIEPREAKYLMKKARKKNTKGKRRRKPVVKSRRNARCLPSTSNQQLPPVEMNDHLSDEEIEAFDDSLNNDQLVSGISHDHSPSAESLNRTLSCPSSHRSLDQPQPSFASSPHSHTASSSASTQPSTPIDRSDGTPPSTASVSNILPAGGSPEGNGEDDLMEHDGPSGSGIRTTGGVRNGSLPTLMELAGLVHREPTTNPCSSSSHDSSSSSTLLVTINDDEMDDRPHPSRFFMRHSPPYRPNAPSACSHSNSYPSARSLNPPELISPSSGSDSGLSLLYDMLDEIDDGIFIDIHAESDALKVNFMEQMSVMKETFKSMWKQMRRMETEKADSQRKRRNKEKNNDDRLALEKELKITQETALEKNKSLDKNAMEISKLSSQIKKLNEELEVQKKNEQSLINEYNTKISKVSSQNEKLKEELDVQKKNEQSLIKGKDEIIAKLNIEKEDLGTALEKEVNKVELSKDKDAEFDLLVKQRDDFRKKYIEQIKKNYPQPDAQKKGKSTENRKVYMSLKSQKPCTEEQKESEERIKRNAAVIEEMGPMSDGDAIYSRPLLMWKPDAEYEEFNEIECKAFEAGFTNKEIPKKDFSAIKEKCLPSRSIGDLLQHYYGWKGPQNGKYIFHAKSKSAQFDLIAKGGVDLGPRKRTAKTNHMQISGRATNKRRKTGERIDLCSSESSA